MFKAFDQDSNMIKIEQAEESGKYYCPVCKGTLLVKAKKSETIAAHFAHRSRKDCDTFSHDMSDWHKAWQDRFPLKNQEVPLPFDNPCHRADVLAYGYVIEFQHSPISIDEFDERNRFYTSIGKKVVWVFDVREKYEAGRFQKKSIGNEYRYATTFCSIPGPPDVCEGCGVDYEYGRNNPKTVLRSHEWKWLRPLNSLIHYNPAVNPNVTVFLEFQPDRLQKIIWCQEEIDEYEAGAIAERLHGAVWEPSAALYLKYRTQFAIRSDYRHFTATEYSNRNFINAIQYRRL